MTLPLELLALLSGTWLLPRLGINIGSGFVSTIVVATIGAVLLLLIIGMVSGGVTRRRWGFPWLRWRL